ncbi:hypothetical protein FJY90_04725 [Candidatus Gottesmanbacteria bacterium]|nr:hypothetical protein [Candidatus Gottesmanbacteria bacterium]
MNLITVDISDFRNKLSDYLTLVNLGKAIVSVRNAKSGREVVRIIGPTVKAETLEKRTEELLELAGFAAASSNKLRKKFAKMEIDYIKKLKRNIVE